MKIAMATSGTEILASEVAPNEAVCPSCGEVVILRKRKRMNSDSVSYFWRHQQKPKHCRVNGHPSRMV